MNPSPIANQPVCARRARWRLTVAVLVCVGVQSELARAEDGWASWAKQNCDEVVELRAYGADVTTPFAVPADREIQAPFLFDASWGDRPVHAMAFHPLVDNRKVTADFALYATDGTAGGRRLLYDWFPGSDETRHLGPNVGIPLPRGAKALVLETHYWNQTQPSQTDRSGVAVCLGRGESRLVAGVVDLGAPSVKIPKSTQQHVVSRTCTFASPQFVVLLNAAPGMHRLGTGFSVKVEKSDGTPKAVIDRSYRFGERVGVDLAADLEKGDRITTTCAYSNPLPTDVTQGWRSEDELCRVNLTYYPEGAFACD